MQLNVKLLSLFYIKIPVLIINEKRSIEYPHI